MKSSETESLLKRETKGGTLKPGSVKHWKRSRLGILSVVICFYFLPLCISTYLLNEWIQHSLKEQYFKNGDFNGNFSSCEDANHSSNAYKTYTKVQQNSAHWIMYINVASHVTAFISNLILPGYTDTYGRKFSIILSLVGMTVRSGTLCLIIYTNKKFIYIVAAYAVDGLTGSYFALLNVGFSYVADIVKEPKERVLTIVVIASIEVISAMISGLVAGLCVEKFGFSIPALGCTGMVFCGLILVIAFLPESLAQELRTKPVSILASLKRPFEFYTSSTFAGKRLEYVLLLLAFAFAELGSTNRSPMETVYLLGMPFCWTPKKIGYFSLARHFGQVVIGLGSVKLFQKCMSNELIAITSTVSCIAGYIVEGLATSELAIYMGEYHSGKTAMIRESSHGSGVCKKHYA